ncbi:hypothetical protein HPB51_013999 [Rhipicephalus microplus]|uniref:E3 ubiquitin-protein transferase MAEA n=2 Tax=Rhipicephalus microplus TaxID=6941 RepID=A0A9J6D9R9_RHIMP|nr:hypothetical protein HPB51_013999 [Rhipicephalus microplus]
MLHFSRDLQMPKRDGHVPQQRRTKTKRPNRGRHRSDTSASQSGRLSRLTSRLPAADDGEKPAETPCFSCDRSSAAGAPSYSTSARCALLGQRRNTRNKQPNLEGYDGVAEAAGRPAPMGCSLPGSQPRASQTPPRMAAAACGTPKVPYEILNKKFRAAQKIMDREVSHVQSGAAELEKSLRGKVPAGQLRTQLGCLLEKLELLRRKSAESITEELEAAAACKRRVEHLKGFEAGGEQWKRQRLDRMLVEHLLRAGYYGTAAKLAERSELRDQTNMDLFLVAKEVEDSLASRDTSKCLAWCHDNKSKLRKLRSTLEFQLRQQEFVELVRRDRRLEAVRHARRHFGALEDEAQLAEVQRVMGLLALPNIRPPAGQWELLSENRWSLMADSRWDLLRQQFRQEQLRLYQLSSCSVLIVTLQAGLSALKTPQCYDENQRNPDCPVCSRPLNCLALGLPYAHCSQSRLVCRISGQPLNEHNQPLVLPNGFVYGEQALRAIARHGRVTCPRSRDSFDLREAEKVYVM